jgi:hypothetical protein
MSVPVELQMFLSILECAFPVITEGAPHDRAHPLPKTECLVESTFRKARLGMTTSRFDEVTQMLQTYAAPLDRATSYSPDVD